MGYKAPVAVPKGVAAVVSEGNRTVTYRQKAYRIIQKRLLTGACLHCIILPLTAKKEKHPQIVHSGTVCGFLR